MVSRIARITPRVNLSADLKAADVILFLLLTLVIIGLHPMRPIARGMLSGDGDADRQIAYLALFLGSALTLGRVQDLRRLAPFPLTLALLFGWCWLSLFWAIAPMIALRRLALTTMLAWIAFMAVERAGFDRTLRMLRLVLVVALALNYFAVFFTPVGVHQMADPLDPGLAGNWRGFLLHKNFAGAICAVTIFAFLVRDRLAAQWRYAVILAAAYFLYRTASKTSMGLMVVGLVCGWFYMLPAARNRPILVPLAALALLVFLYAATVYVGGYLSPDALTGRVQIWPVLLEYYHHNPWLGSGFGSFWNIGADSPVYRYARNWIADLASGHNGYLDILVQIGLPGLALTIIALVITPIWHLLANTQVPPRQGAFLIACLIFCAGHNLTESNFLNRDAFVEMVQILAIALTAHAVRHNLRAASAKAPVRPHAYPAARSLPT